MALVVQGVCRFAVNALMGEQEVVNVLDMHIDTTGSVGSRDDAILEQAGIILGEWNDEVMTFITAPYVAQSVSWVDLDSATGSTGVVTTGSGVTWPQPGTAAGTSLPPNTAALIIKQTINGRLLRNGRMYVAGIAENITPTGTPWEIQPVSVDFINTAMAAFLGDINQGDPDPTDFQSSLVVVHNSPSLPAPTHSDVTGLVVESRLATQRGRLRD